MTKINKVFVNAPIFNIENHNKETFASLATQIRGFNIQAITPSLEMDFIADMDKDVLLKFLTKHMVGCNLIVTHGDWYNFNECVKLNEIARILNIEVVHHSRLSERLSTNSKNTQ